MKITNETHEQNTQNTPDKNKTLSRRSFLKALPLGFAGAVLISGIGARLLGQRSGRLSKPPELPEDSIFAPDKNRYGA